MHGCLWAKTPEAAIQCNIVPIKTGFCASSVCISLLKHELKLKRHTVGQGLLLLHNARNTLNSRLLAN